MRLRAPYRNRFRWGPLPGPGLGQPASDAPPEPGVVAEPGDALMVEALDPAPHGGGVVAEGLGDGGRCEDVRWG